MGAIEAVVIIAVGFKDPSELGADESRGEGFEDGASLGIDDGIFDSSFVGEVEISVVGLADFTSLGASE